MTDMIIDRDSNLTPNSGISFSDSGQYITMAALGTASLAVPAGMTIAFIQIQPGATVLIGTDSFTYASSTSFVAGTFDINPAVRTVVGGTDTLYFEAIDAAIVKVSFYRR